jgi:hypothetical protein
MATPLETQILDDFRRRLDESPSVPPALLDKLAALVAKDKAPTADAVMAAIKANVGDRPV